MRKSQQPQKQQNQLKTKIIPLSKNLLTKKSFNLNKWVYI